MNSNRRAGGEDDCISDAGSTASNIAGRSQPGAGHLEFLAPADDCIWHLVLLPPEYQAMNVPRIDHRVLEAKSIIDSAPARPWKAASLAVGFGLSPSHFSRLFNRQLGHSFKSYVVARRVEFAKRMLLTTKLSVKEISFQCGFRDPSHFVRAFRSMEGVTPNHFRACSWPAAPVSQLSSINNKEWP